MRNFTLTLLVSFSMLAGFSSTAIAAEGAQGDPDKHSMVFGKFRLLKNGNDTKLGDGFFGNVAALLLYRVEDQEEFTIRVGDHGEFSRELAPGDYYITNISFKFRGETIRPETNFMIRVSDDGQPNYVGTITLEATFSGGYHGSKGSFERFTISNDCAVDCERRLVDLGLAGEYPTTSLPEWQTQVAFSR